MILVPLFFILCGELSWCQQMGDAFKFSGGISHYAVSADTVYVATEEKLYQLSHKLTLVQSLNQRGILKSMGRPEDAQFHRVSEKDKWNATFIINVLLTFVKNGTVVSCGLTNNNCGYCEVLDLKDISNVLYSERILVGPPWRSNKSVAFLVTLKTSMETYIMTAIDQYEIPPENKCAPESNAAQLWNTFDNQTGHIFSSTGELSAVAIKLKGTKNVMFVDGFQVDSFIYLLSNLPSKDKSNKVRLIWLEAQTGKTDTLESLRGATLTIPEAGNRSRLLGSSVVPGGLPVLWSGVFSMDRGPTNSQLVLFDISPVLDDDRDSDPDFCSVNCGENPKLTARTLKPKKVLLSQNHMTSVLAVRHKAWMVFFIGTGDGQLFKLTVDQNYNTNCPKVLYKANDNRQVFPSLYLDPVDHRHIYVPFENQIKRLPVSQCSTYTDLQGCWSARDAYCVWCGSNERCTLEENCPGSNWVSIPDVFHQKMISYQVEKDSTDQITVTVQAHLTVGRHKAAAFNCHFTNSTQRYGREAPSHLQQFTCMLTKHMLPAEDLSVTVEMRIGRTYLSENMKISNCIDIAGPPTPVLCQQCVEAGCGWSGSSCTWANQGERNASVCRMMVQRLNFSTPEITSIYPSNVSFYGRNNAMLSGLKLGGVTRVRIQMDMGCTPIESPVLSNNGENLTFHIPSVDSKGLVKVCVVLSDGSCHGSAKITYLSLPSCTNAVPSSSWISGKRKITLIGSRLEFVEGVIHSHAPQKVQPPININYQNLTYDTPAAEYPGIFTSSLFFKVANNTSPCSLNITYYPDPEFVTFTSTRLGDGVRIAIQKKADELQMTLDDLSAWGVLEEREYPCIMKVKETRNSTELFICEIQMASDSRFQKLKILYGDKTKTLDLKSSQLLYVLLVLLLIPCICVLAAIIYCRKQKMMTALMDKRFEALELSIRKDIRQGFVDLQTEEAHLMENVGAIPFLDYKHFATQVFFPKNESLLTLCMRDIGQDAMQVQLSSCCQGLSKLVQDQLFLTSMVHALEEQKSFSINDKCELASLLTVALHSNLSYLTEVMEALLRDLIQQTSSTQSKLLLRRTETIVEKLVTNWMSVCLYGFLRESVGQHLFLTVSALTQQMAKGPVDCVTERALYTLSEDWLLCQAPDFSSLKLKVLFAVGSDGEVSEPLEVGALNCDTVEQVKVKILSSFKAKFGFPYSYTLRELCVEYEKNGTFVPLEEVDASSEIIGEVTMLNTLKHYKVPDGATIKVLCQRTHPPLSPQGSLRDEANFSGKYFHLIDPDVVEDQRKNPEQKKLKLKEVHLIKLLSTKVAVHSYVENLFKSIWGLVNSKAPPAVKYFFDFLDTQADSLKIADPDVLHIWKTNSLPLRFWVNIIKNPQFVFDMEKTKNLDGCLSVIAQAFMDSFSLSETQLGKYAPTNKLLYAKDIPKFKQEVKAYYKQVRDQPSFTASEFKDFLKEESQKHENEFNEAAALREIYKFIKQYFSEIKKKLDESGAPTELIEQLHHVKSLFDEQQNWSWN